ncbi:methyltransferase domain-containing protein [Marinactinospora endophytica]
MTSERDSTPRPLGDAPLIRRMRSSGVPEEILRAFARVRREEFLPDRVWDERGGEVVRSDSGEEWSRLVHSDAAVVVQRDDGVAGGRGVVTSSSSAPSVMAAMLQAADVRRGTHVLEIGTATGYNAALLGELTGAPETVTTVEIDAALAERARSVLRDIGHHPRVVVGDGALGHPATAPFDRVLATCAVARVPAPWIDQTREGGLIVCPWAPSSALPGGLLARLTVRDGTAEGPFVRLVSFMWLSGQREEPGVPHDLGASPDRVCAVDRDPRSLLLDGTRALPLALMVPAWRFGVRMGTQGEPQGEPLVWLSALDGASWARLYPDRVEQGGPRLLWDEIEAAHRRWRALGGPPATAFGLTIAGGTHRVWLGDPSGPSWSLP